MKYVYGALALLLFQLLVGLVIVYSGTISVAADEPHSPPVRWLLDTARDRSIRYHAEDLSGPPMAVNAAAGFSAFVEMCVVCHGAPGKQRGLIGQGLRPRAPDLAEVARRRSPQELFWVVKHGIKMTGMPAWGETHSDQELWEVVAFVERLGSLSAEDYRALESESASGNDGHGHAHGEGGS